MIFNLEAEVKRATAAYLSLEGIAIPESIRKPTEPEIPAIYGICIHCGHETEDRHENEWLHDDCNDALVDEQREDERLDDPRHNQADYLNRS